ncbi:MAG: radical SAM protein [archaeon]
MYDSKNHKIQKMILMTTNQCNFNCDYCYVNHDNQIMDYEIAQKSIDWFINYNNTPKNEVLKVSFLGGEPLLRWNLIKKTILYSEQFNRKIKFDITTNGSLLSNDKFDFIEKHNIDLKLSIDGPSYVHDIHRKDYNNNGTFKLIKPIMKEGIERNIFKGARSTITSKTVKYTFESYEYLYNLGFKNIEIVPEFFHNWDEESFLEYKNQFDLIDEKFSELMSQNKQPGIFYYNTCFYHIEKDIKLTKPCLAGKESVSINFNGDIYPCQLFIQWPEWKIGDIYNGLLEHDLLNSLSNFNCNLIKDCKDCDVKLCGGGCYGLNYIHNNNFYEPNSSHCKIMKDRWSRIIKHYNNFNDNKYFLGMYKLKNNKPKNNDKFTITNVQLVITDSCNFKCNYCFENHSPKRISTKHFFDALKYIINHSNEKTIINLFGGEPMLEWERLIIPMFKFLKENNYVGQTSIITNGSLLNEEIIDTMIDNKMNIMISIDGNYKVQSTHRISNDTVQDYYNIIKNIKYLTEKKKYDKLEARLTYTEETLPYLFQSFKFLYNIHFRKIQLYHKYDIKISDNSILREQLRKIFIFYSKHKGMNVFFINRILHFILYPEKYNRHELPNCGIVNDKENISYSVNTDGDYFTCHHFNASNPLYSKFNIGNIENGLDFNAIDKLSVDYLIKTNKKQYLEREEKCSNCKMYNLCSGICIMQNLQVHGNIFTNDEVACKINNIMYDVIYDLLKHLLPINKKG